MNRTFFAISLFAAIAACGPGNPPDAKPEYGESDSSGASPEISESDPRSVLESASVDADVVTTTEVAVLTPSTDSEPTAGIANTDVSAVRIHALAVNDSGETLLFEEYLEPNEDSDEYDGRHFRLRYVGPNGQTTGILDSPSRHAPASEPDADIRVLPEGFLVATSNWGQGHYGDAPRFECQGVMTSALILGPGASCKRALNLSGVVALKGVAANTSGELWLSYTSFGMAGALAPIEHYSPSGELLRPWGGWGLFPYKHPVMARSGTLLTTRSDSPVIGLARESYETIWEGQAPGLVQAAWLLPTGEVAAVVIPRQDAVFAHAALPAAEVVGLVYGNDGTERRAFAISGAVLRSMPISLDDVGVVFEKNSGTKRSVVTYSWDGLQTREREVVSEGGENVSVMTPSVQPHAGIRTVVSLSPNATAKILGRTYSAQAQGRQFVIAMPR